MAIDVWYTSHKGREEEIVSSIREGKKRMRELLKGGQDPDAVVMYVRTGDVKDNRQYFFKKGKIVFIKDNYDN